MTQVSLSWEGLKTHISNTEHQKSKTGAKTFVKTYVNWCENILLFAKLSVLKVKYLYIYLSNTLQGYQYNLNIPSWAQGH